MYARKNTAIFHAKSVWIDGQGYRKNYGKPGKSRDAKKLVSS
jgi:hypothetical protein